MNATNEAMRTPRVSVIIPTWNRCNLLRHTIESLVGQTATPSSFEVIIIDDGSTDGTGRMVEGLRLRVPFRLIYRQMEKNRGPVIARNFGASIARGEILAFTDSDCRASRNWVDTAISAFSADPMLAFITGPTINVPGQPVRFFSVGGADCAGENPTYPAANVIYRKSVFEDVGGFDPSAFLYNAGPTPLDCSDVDLAWRVKETGKRNLFLTELVMHHEVRQLKPWEWLAHYTRIMTIPELVRRHPGFGKAFLWWGPFCLPENPLFYSAAAGLTLAWLTPWFLLLALPFLLRIVVVLGRATSKIRLPYFLAQVGFLGIRQAVICGSLVYGSIRARTVVL